MSCCTRPRPGSNRSTCSPSRSRRPGSAHRASAPDEGWGVTRRADDVSEGTDGFQFNRWELDMRVFVAGGTGVIGRHLVPALIADGHQVTASSRSPDKAADLAAAGADPVV